MSSQTPFPSSGNYTKSILASSKRVCEREDISISQPAVERLLASHAFTESFERLSSFPGLALPLKFASHLDELNVISILSLLNFGSGFETPLRAQTGHGASNAMKALIFSMYITSNTTEGDLLSAKGIAALTSAKVAELMGVDVMIEKPHPQLPGIIVGEPGGPLLKLVVLVTKVLNDTGKTLLTLKYPNLGFFVVEVLKEGHRQASQSGSMDTFADFVLEKLVCGIPAFQDALTVDGEHIYIFNKALFLINAISARFNSLSSPPFPIPPVTDLPAFADGVLPSLLLSLCVVDISSCPRFESLRERLSSEATTQTLLQGKATISTENRPPQEGPILSQDQAYILRAASIVAIDSFPTIPSQPLLKSDKAWIRDLSVPQLNTWFAAITKDRPDYRNLPTIVYKDTVYF